MKLALILSLVFGLALLVGGEFMSGQAGSQYTNGTGNPSCADLGFLHLVKRDPPTDGAQAGYVFDFHDGGNEVDISSAPGTPVPFDRAIVKGGSHSNYRIYSFNEATSALDLETGTGQAISHVTLCYDVEATATDEPTIDEPTTTPVDTTTPTATATGTPSATSTRPPEATNTPTTTRTTVPLTTPSTSTATSTPTQDATVTTVPTESPTPCVLEGDVNGDGRVSILDIVIIVSHFGEYGQGVVGQPWDLNDDGVVSTWDITHAVKFYGKVCE